jgi:GNAT superfamily N-acetyltransferase
MIVRPMRPEEEPVVLQLFNETAVLDSHGEPMDEDQLSDFLANLYAGGGGVWLAEGPEGMAGYTWAVREMGPDLIRLTCWGSVLPERRQRGYGRALIETVRTWALGLPAGGRHMVLDIPVAMPGSKLHTLLPAMGFQVERTNRHVKISSLAHLPPCVVLEGATFRTYQDDDGPEIARAFNWAYRHLLPAPRSLEMIRHYVSADVPVVELVSVDSTGRLSGFFLASGKSDHTGMLWWIGSAPGQSGHGLGAALIINGLHAMRAAGLHSAEGGYNVGETPVAPVFRRLGFEPVLERVFHRWVVR